MGGLWEAPGGKTLRRAAPSTDGWGSFGGCGALAPSQQIAAGAEKQRAAVMRSWDTCDQYPRHPLREAALQTALPRSSGHSTPVKALIASS